MLVLLAAGVAVLMAGIMLMDRDSGQNPYVALKDSLIWGASFIFSFGAEFVAFAKMF
jgi:hypothetical protein